MGAPLVLGSVALKGLTKPNLKIGGNPAPPPTAPGRPEQGAKSIRAAEGLAGRQLAAKQGTSQLRRQLFGLQVPTV